MLGGTLSLATASQGGKVAWVVPTYKNGRSLWRWADRMSAPARMAGEASSNKTERVIEFANGGLFGIFSADNEDSIRGEAFNLVILDEAARIPETAWTDAIMPTLADYEGDAILISTPKGLNWFYNEWSRGRDDMKYQASWTAPSSANPMPQIQRAAAMAQQRVPDRTYRQEWLAEFISDGAYFQGVDAAATVAQPDTPEQHAGHRIYMAADWALSGDFTVLVAGCQDCAKVVDWDRFNNLDFTYQRERLYSMAEFWNVDGVLPERNSVGEPNMEIIQDRVYLLPGPDGKPGFNTSATTKPPLIQGLATALEHDGYQVPVTAADELRAFEVETLVSGHPKFEAPQGMHDDWVIALALLWYAMTSASTMGGIHV